MFPLCSRVGVVLASCYWRSELFRVSPHSSSPDEMMDQRQWEERGKAPNKSFRGTNPDTDVRKGKGKKEKQTNSVKGKVGEGGQAARGSTGREGPRQRTRCLQNVRLPPHPEQEGDLGPLRLSAFFRSSIRSWAAFSRGKSLKLHLPLLPTSRHTDCMFAYRDPRQKQRQPGCAQVEAVRRCSFYAARRSSVSTIRGK